MSDGWGDGGWPEGAPAQEDKWGGAGQAQAAKNQAEAPPSQDDFLLNESVKSFSFDGPPGTTADGLVHAEPQVVQKINFDTRQPEFWDNGRPKWQLRVHLQIPGLHEFDDDDGVRSLFFDYKKKEALDEALKAVGAKRVDVGARLRVEYLGGGPKDREKDATRYKRFKVSYAPPGSPAATALANQPAQPSAPPRPAQPSYADEPPF